MTHHMTPKSPSGFYSDRARTVNTDYITQSQLAVRATREARPDMTASEALAMVKLVGDRYEGDWKDGK